MALKRSTNPPTPPSSKSPEPVVDLRCNNTNVLVSFSSSSIIFVHGITGHREHTWSVGNGIRPWPETFLPTKIPDARISSFGYDASVIGWRGISSNNISDHAKNLLAALATLRESDNDSVMEPWTLKSLN